MTLTDRHAAVSIDRSITQPSSEKLLVKVGINTAIHSRTVCRQWEFGALSPKGAVFIKVLPSRLRYLCKRGGRKIGCGGAHL